jgi:beta-lactamase regulating signal transducer with metallopeptidase domain
MKSLQLLFAQPLAADLGWTLLHFVWQGALISALLAGVRRLVAGSASARARYALACLTLATMASAPILTYGFLAGSDTWQSASVQVHAIPVTLAASGGSLAAPWYWSWLGGFERAMPWLVMAWFMGAVVLLIRLAGGSFVTARLRSNANRPTPRHLQDALSRIAAQLGVSNPVRLLVSSLVEVPVVVGWFRPVVLMPVGALTGLAPEHLEALLAHELAHIRRHDYLVNVLQSVLEAVLFYHPAIWWVSNQIRKERELCCDDLAVAASGDALTYVRALADLESCRPTHVRAAIAANGGSLLHRIRRLADPSQPVSHTVIGPMAAFVVTLTVLSGASLVVLRGAPAPAAPGGVVDRNTIWVDTVKRGDMSVAVRGLGKLTTGTTADLQIPTTLIKEVQPGQIVSMQFHDLAELATGKVTRITPGVSVGTVTVQIESGLPHGVQQGVDIDGTIELDRLSDVVLVGRPVEGTPTSEGTLFKLEPNGDHAVRVKVEFGRASVNTIQILGGVEPGDKVILSDTSAVKGYDRITLK